MMFVGRFSFTAPMAASILETATAVSIVSIAKRVPI